MTEQGVKVRYMHSDIDTVERIEIIRDLRMGVFDVLIGINLLREGLDIPECAFVSILDVDKRLSALGNLHGPDDGRAARNADAKVVLYADKVTGSMARAMEETERRRTEQIHFVGERHHPANRLFRHQGCAGRLCPIRPARLRRAA